MRCNMLECTIAEAFDGVLITFCIERNRVCNQVEHLCNGSHDMDLCRTYKAELHAQKSFSSRWLGSAGPGTRGPWM